MGHELMNLGVFNGGRKSLPLETIRVVTREGGNGGFITSGTYSGLYNLILEYFVSK